MNYRLVFSSPVGFITLESNQKAITALKFGKSGASRKHPLLDKAQKQLGEYFAGKRKKFILPLEPEGSSFQKTVWNSLKRVPYGKVKNYEKIAKAIKNPKACRAVGTACGKNPIPIIIPCHRIVAKDNSLGGFSSGLNKKRYLLKLEGTQWPYHI